MLIRFSGMENIQSFMNGIKIPRLLSEIDRKTMIIAGSIIGVVIASIIFMPTNLFAKADTSQTIEYAQEERGFGLSSKRLMYATINGKKETIGFASIIQGQTLASIASLAGSSKYKLPSAAVDLIETFNTIKNTLSVDLDQVVFLENLYVEPMFRGRGYAHMLIENTCQEIFNTTEAKFIALTPNPFEFIDAKQVSLKGTSEYDAKKAQVIKLYQQCGFIQDQEDAVYMYKAKSEENEYQNNG